MSILPDEILARLVDPETHEPLRPATAPELDSLRDAIASGKARRKDGAEPPADFEAAFVTGDGRRAYLVAGGIPNFLVDERIELEPPPAR